MTTFRKGQGTTFASGTDRSGGALRAEYGGLESARDAARRLSIRPWRLLEAAGQLIGGEWSETAGEWHHQRISSRVVDVDYREADEWNSIANHIREIGISAAKSEVNKWMSEPIK